MTKNSLSNALIRAAFGFVCIMICVGPLLDACTIFTTGSVISWPYALGILASGLPVNLTHGVACFLTLLLFSNPLLDKLDRIKVKYGMMEAENRGI